MGSCQSGNTEKSDFKLDTARVVAMPFDRDAAPSRFGFKSKLPAQPPKANAKEVVSTNHESASKPTASVPSRFGFRPVRPAPSEQATLMGNGNASEKAPLIEPQPPPPPLEAAKLNGNGSCKQPYGNKLTIYRSNTSIISSKESLSSKENQRKPARPAPKAQKPSSHSSPAATTEALTASTGFSGPRTAPALGPRFNAQRKAVDSGGKYDLSKVKDELRLKVVPSAARPKSAVARLEPEQSLPRECNAGNEANEARQALSDASSNASDSAYCSQPCSVCEERTDKAEENSDMMRSTESSSTNTVTQSDLMHVDVSICTDSAEQMIRQRLLFDQIHSLFSMNCKDQSQSQIVQVDDLVIMQSETYCDLIEELRSMKRLLGELGQALQNTDTVWLPPTSLGRCEAATQTNKYETLIPAQSNGQNMETQIVRFPDRRSKLPISRPR